MKRTLSIIALAALTTFTAAAGAVTLSRTSAPQAPPQAAQQTPDLTDTTTVARATNVSRSRLVTPAPEPTPSPKPVSAPRPVVYGSVADARAYALGQVGSAQFFCLDALWQRESGWNPGAMNPSSGAYGIPQALPAGKMAAFGGDWAYNPVTQVRWGLSYISASYGSPCGAWSFWQSRHYY